MKIFWLWFLLLACGCQDVLSPQLRRMPVSQLHDSGEKLVLHAAGRRVVLRKESSAAIIDGIPVQLYDAVQRSDSQWSLSEKSVNNILLPIVTARRIPVQKILIDPGHGGSDAGAVSASGVKEKDLNLSLAKKLAGKLASAGFQLCMTRTTDKFVTLENRVKMAGACGAELFISIHHNSSATNPNAAGMETFALNAVADAEYRTSGHSHVLAFLIQQEQSGLSNSPGRGVKHARFKVLRQTFCPAVLIEAGFVSNQADLKRCASPEYQTLLAEAIARAVTAFAIPR